MHPQAGVGARAATASTGFSSALNSSGAERPPYFATHSGTGVLLSTQRTLPRAARLPLISCPGRAAAAHSSNRSTAVKVLLQLWQELRP
jgi:hypothetical protein